VFHSLESVNAIQTMQENFGRSDTSTMTFHLHVSNRDGQAVISPIDSMK